MSNRERKKERVREGARERQREGENAVAVDDKRIIDNRQGKAETERKRERVSAA